MTSAAAWLNHAWMLKCSGEALAFAWASRRVAQTQAGLLRRMLAANRDTAFGLAHDFAAITSPAEYQRRVPLATWDDFAGPIQRIAAGEPNVLTREPVRLLEPTSGTTGGEKLIPYTATLRRQFQRGVTAWIADLFRHRPAVRRGRAYWSISPAFGPPRRSPGGIPIGFADDAAYLGRLEQYALRKLLVAPAVSGLADLRDFRYATLLALLAAEDLTLISVWNPSFLTSLLAPLAEWQDRLCFDLRRVNPRRAERVGRLLNGSGTSADRLRLVWPRLALISCWTDAAAALALPALRELFPAVEVQPKGLLATEGFVSLPLVDRPGAALAVRSHFFEFEELDAALSARCRLAQELDRGGRYRVILTTGGGLYRYQLRDLIEIVGFEHQCPLLRFLGKSDLVSDLTGEKLAEPHVRSVLDRSPTLRALRPSFALLVPALDQPPRYRLYLQGPELTCAQAMIEQLRTELQRGLEENPYYRHAVGIGQLGEVAVEVLDPQGESGWHAYESRCVAEGRKAGDVKPTALDPRTDWPERFAALTVSSGRR